MHDKFVLSAHTLMHTETQPYSGGVTGVDGRRTDDRTGWSASLQQFHTGFALYFQRRIAPVADFHLGINWRVELHIPVI